MKNFNLSGYTLDESQVTQDVLKHDRRDETSTDLARDHSQSKLTPKALARKLQQSGVSGMRAPVHHIPSPNREPTAEEKQAHINAVLIKRGKAILMQETLEMLEPYRNNVVAQQFLLLKRCNDLTKALVEAGRNTGKPMTNMNVVAPVIMEELTRVAQMLPPSMAKLMHNSMPPAAMAEPVKQTLEVMSPPDRTTA